MPSSPASAARRSTPSSGPSALDRLAQPVGGGGLGRGRLGAAEVGEDRRAIVRRVGLLERAPQVHRRRPRRAAAQGVGGGRPQRDRDVRARARARLQRVGGDALDGRAGRMEDLDGPPVRRRALGRAHLLVDRPPDDGVRERGPVPRREERGGAQRVDGGAGRVRADAGQRGKPRDRRAVAEDRERAGDGGGLGGDGPQRQRDGARHRRGTDLAHAGDTGLRGRDALLRERRQQLGEQERVAAGRVVARGDEGGLGPRRARLDQPPRGRLAQRGQAQDPRRRLGGELGEERPVDGAQARPVGDDDRDRQVGDARPEVDDEPQRELVGPVGVVDDEGERRALGEVGGQPVQAVEERVRRARVRPRSVRGRIEAEELGGEARAALEQPPALGGAGRADARLEQLAGDAERELALELAPAGGEDLEAAGAGLLARRREQRRLAEAGRGLDENDASIAAVSGGEGVIDGLDLRISLEQCAQEFLRGRTLVRAPAHRRCGSAPADRVSRGWRARRPRPSRPRSPAS